MKEDWDLCYKNISLPQTGNKGNHFKYKKQVPVYMELSQKNMYINVNGNTSSSTASIYCDITGDMDTHGFESGASAWECAAAVAL